MGDVLQSMTSELLPKWKLISIAKCKTRVVQAGGQWLLVIDQNIGEDLLSKIVHLSAHLWISAPREGFLSLFGEAACLVKLFVTRLQSDIPADPRKPSSNCVSLRLSTFDKLFLISWKIFLNFQKNIFKLWDRYFWKPSSNCVSLQLSTFDKWSSLPMFQLFQLFDCTAICSTASGETNCHPAAAGICSLI